MVWSPIRFGVFLESCCRAPRLLLEWPRSALGQLLGFLHGVMEKKMETTAIIGVILLGDIGTHWGNIRVMWGLR